MTHPTPVITSNKSVHWTVRTNYRLRAGSFVPAFFVVASHVWGKGYGPVLWGLLVLQFLVYPHLMYWRAVLAADPKKAEQHNILIDPLLFGLWMGALQFPLLITFLFFITSLVNNAASIGFKGLFKCALAQIAGVLAAVFIFGWHLAPETGWLTSWITMTLGAFYLIAIGLLCNDANRRLRNTRIKLSESNATLALTLDDLRATQTQLERANKDFRRLLDNSGEGFLTFGPNLLIDAQYSLTCETMLGCSPAGRPAAEIFFHDDPVKANLFSTIINSVLDESDPDIQECMLSLLPTESTHGDVILKVEYKTLDNHQFMTVLTDITKQRHIEVLLKQERQRLELVVMAVSDRRNFFETIDAFSDFLEKNLSLLLHSSQAPNLLGKALYREIHTFKGLLSQFSFPNSPKALHAIESQLTGLLALGDALATQQLVDVASPAALRQPFEADLAILSDALGRGFLQYGDSITLSEVQARQLQRLAIRLLRGETVDTSVTEIRNLLQDIGTLCKVSFKDVLLGFDGLVRQAAQRMGKSVAAIEVIGGADVWIDPNAYRPFLRALVHVFRNAVAHGLESPEARWEAQKDETGKITCNVETQGNAIHLSIADDGAGINLQALRQRAVNMGIYTADAVAQLPDEAVVQLIFKDNISTQQDVSDLAGRGVGLAAVLNETKNAGGEVEVKTIAGQGTEFLFKLPLQSALLAEGDRFSEIDPG